MSQIKELLVDQLQGMLDAENQLVGALPKMAGAAKSPKLREALEKHLKQTQMHVERLNRALELLGAEAEATPCRAMQGLIQEGDEKIREGGRKEETASDLSLITAAQKVEHYEIAAYGTARTLALELDEVELARLLGHTLGEEESADYLLTEVSKPILQEARMNELTGEGQTVGSGSKRNR